MKSYSSSFLGRSSLLYIVGAQSVGILSTPMQCLNCPGPRAPSRRAVRHTERVPPRFLHGPPLLGLLLSPESKHPAFICKGRKEGVGEVTEREREKRKGARERERGRTACRPCSSWWVGRRKKEVFPPPPFSTGAAGRSSISDLRLARSLRGHPQKTEF